MIPGEIIAASGDIELNSGAPTISIDVSNTGDRPVQVGSHYHFAETNGGLAFDREQARACGSIFQPGRPCGSSRARHAR